LQTSTSSIAHDHPPGIDREFLNTLERPDNHKNPSRKSPATHNSLLCCTDEDAVKVQYRVEREPGGGLVVMTDTFTSAYRAEITSLAARYRLPSVYPYRFFAEIGGLLSYGNDLVDNFRRAAIYADRILKGAKPADLPVQAPVKFELVLNLKTARALGLDVPTHLQQRPDAVIE
jgi:ABC transporter substrate binding protein